MCVTSNRVSTKLLPLTSFAVGSHTSYARLHERKLLTFALARKRIQTQSNCSAAFFTKSLLLLRTPASKLRVFLPFIPRPAPVRFAEPTKAVFKSKTMILK